MNAEQSMSFGNIVYMIWMIAGVLGVSASFGWIVFLVQRYAKATTDKERLDRKAQLKKAGLVLLAFVLLLAGFVVYNVIVRNGQPAA